MARLSRSRPRAGKPNPNLNPKLNGAANRPADAGKNAGTALTPGQIRALASVLSSRSELSSRAGITFQGHRDLFRVLGYKRDLECRDYKERYKRNAIAGRIVEALPKATWRGPEVIEDQDPDIETPFEQAFIELDERIHIWENFLRADVLAGLGQYAVILIGVASKEKAALSEPIPDITDPEDILYLAPFSEDEAPIQEWNVDPADVRFGLPTYYSVRRSATFNSSLAISEQKVHYSRILHIADGVLDERPYGEPRLRRCWNLIDDLEKVTGGGAEAFWLRVHRGTVLNMDPDLKMEPDEETALSEEIDDYTDGISRIMRLRGIEVKELGGDVANNQSQVDAILTQISGGTGIPKRILTGSEMGELASTQDRSNWNERVEDRREQFADPVIARSFIDMLIEMGALPEPEEYEVRFADIAKMDDGQRATIAGSWAQLNAKQGEIVVTGAEIRDRVLGLPKLEESDPEAAEINAMKREQMLNPPAPPVMVNPETGEPIPPGTPGAIPDPAAPPPNAPPTLEQKTEDGDNSDGEDDEEDENKGKPKPNPFAKKVKAAQSNREIAWQPPSKSNFPSAIRHAVKRRLLRVRVTPPTVTESDCGKR